MAGALEHGDQLVRARPSQAELDPITNDLAVMISDHRQRCPLADVDRHDETTSRIEPTDTVDVAGLGRTTNELHHLRNLLIGTDPHTPTHPAARDGDPL